MSKIYEKYKEYKKQYTDKILLFESGVFYIALSDDAITLSETLGLKLTMFNKDILKCGFPKSALEKYIENMNMYGIEYKIFPKDIKSVKEKKVDKRILFKEKIIKQLGSINMDDMTLEKLWMHYII